MQALTPKWSLRGRKQKREAPVAAWCGDKLHPDRETLENPKVYGHPRGCRQGR